MYIYIHTIYICLAAPLRPTFLNNINWLIFCSQPHIWLRYNIYIHAKNHYSVNYINQPSAKFICPMNLFHLSRFCLNIISHCIQFCYPSIVIANNSLIWLALGNKTSKVARFQEITLKQKNKKHLLKGKRWFHLKVLFFGFWRPETKKPHTLSRETKKKQKTQGTTKKQNFEVKTSFPFQKMFFVFWFQCHFLKSGNFVCFVTKSRNSASRYSTFVRTWFLIWIKYMYHWKSVFSPVIYNVFVLT